MVSGALQNGNDSANKLSHRLQQDLADAGFDYYCLSVSSCNNDNGSHRSYNPDNTTSTYQDELVELNGWFYRAIVVYPV